VARLFYPAQAKDGYVSEIASAKLEKVVRLDLTLESNFFMVDISFNISAD